MACNKAFENNEWLSRQISHGKDASQIVYCMLENERDMIENISSKLLAFKYWIACTDYF